MHGCMVGGGWQTVGRHPSTNPPPLQPPHPPQRFFDRKGEVPPGKKPFFAIPVFNYFEGHLSINYSDNYYLLSQRHAEVPRLTKVRLSRLPVCVRVVPSGGPGALTGLI